MSVKDSPLLGYVINLFGPTIRYEGLQRSVIQAELNEKSGYFGLCPDRRMSHFFYIG